MIRLYCTIAITTAVLCIALLSRSGQAAPTMANTVTSEAWRLGVTSEGDASSAALLGRSTSIAASFRSNRGVQDIYFIFPASGRTQFVQSAAYQLLQRSGSYTDTTSLTLEVRNTSGVLQRTVSAVPIDLQTAITGTWATITLDTSLANLTIAPGEYLVAHFALAGGSAGTLDVRPVFEVVVSSDSGVAMPTATPLPIITPTPRVFYLPLLVR